MSLRKSRNFLEKTHPFEVTSLPKHFVVTGYAPDRSGERVLLLFHRKLRMWLPPGGHVEPHEHPTQSLVREFAEETGLRVRPVGPALRSREPGVLTLARPHHVQVETIDGKHEHIDLVYFCRITGGRLRGNSESEELRWFTRKELGAPEVSENVRRYGRELLRTSHR